MTPADRLDCSRTESAHLDAPGLRLLPQAGRPPGAEAAAVLAVRVAAEAANSRSSLTAYFSARRSGYCSVAPQSSR